MSGKLTEKAYQALIAENIAWLRKNTPDCLERRHITDVLSNSVTTEYPTADPAVMKRGALCNAHTCTAQHTWTGNACPHCGWELIHVGKNGVIFCSNDDPEWGCDYAETPSTTPKGENP